MAIHDVIGERYELTQRIGSGGMAQVYLAVDRLLRRQVAVKILSSETASDPIFVERFRREAQAVAQVNHPNVVSIYDWGQSSPNDTGDPSIYYMVMEYVPGENLKQRLRGGSIPESVALDIAAQVAAALQVAHEHGVIHRDIKPQNVLLDSSGMVKVVDFGIAHTAGVTQLTKTNAVAGTAHYLSPEQAQSRPIDNRADLYSLGVVLFEMLTGREPFGGRTLVEIAMHHVHDSPPRPTSLQPRITPATEAIVLRALEKKPADRFHDAGEMRTALLEAGSALMTSAGHHDQERTTAAPLPKSRPAPGSRTRANRRMGAPENRWPARLRMSIPALILLLVGLPAIGIWQSHKGSRNAVTPPTPKTLATTVPHLAARLTPAPTGARAQPAARITSVAAVPTHSIPDVTVPASGHTVPGTPSPVATRVPSIAALQQPGAPVLDAHQNSPTGTVSEFYRMVSEGDLAGAASMETANMKRVWPPESAIIERFRQTQHITIQPPQLISRTGHEAIVDVSGFDQEKPGSPRSNQNFHLVWTLVKTGHLWLLDSVTS